MPIRFLRYITELYDSFQGETESGKMPAVFPILLYNGEKKWTAPIQFAVCVEDSIPKDYIPAFRYFPVIENEIPKESLLRIKNALSAVFYIENSEVEELYEKLDALFEIIKDENLEIVNQLSNWFNNYLASLGEPLQGKREDFEKEVQKRFESIKEVKHMFATRLKEHDDKIKQQGIEQGIEQGVEKGIEQGKNEAAKNMLADGVSIKQVAKYTGLSKEKIENISKEE